MVANQTDEQRKLHNNRRRLGFKGPKDIVVDEITKKTLMWAGCA